MTPPNYTVLDSSTEESGSQFPVVKVLDSDGLFSFRVVAETEQKADTLANRIVRWIND